MKKSAYFSDVAFAFTLTFLPTLCYLRYRKLGLGASFTVAALLGIAVCLLVAALMQKRYVKRKLKAAEKREAEMLRLHLALLSQKEQSEFFLERINSLFSHADGGVEGNDNGKPLNGVHPATSDGQENCEGARLLGDARHAADSGQENCNDARLLGDARHAADSGQENCEGARLVSRDGKWFIETADTVYYCCFSASAISANEALPLLSYPTEKKIELLCGEVSADAEGFFARFSLRFSNVNELYLKLKQAELLPQTYKSAAAFEKKKKRRFQLWFQKRNARPFLTGGTMVLVTSLFTPFPYYYLVTGCAMLLTAALVRLLGKN